MIYKWGIFDFSIAKVWVSLCDFGHGPANWIGRN